METLSFVTGNVGWISVAALFGVFVMWFSSQRKKISSSKLKDKTKEKPKTAKRLSGNDLPKLPKKEDVAGEKTQFTEIPPVEMPSNGARRCHVASLHVAVWPDVRVLERLNPEGAMDALNEFHSTGAQWAEKLSGIYEKSSGASFYIHWIESNPEFDPSIAIKGALGLREDLNRWNELRKTDSHLPQLRMRVVMGADVGPAVFGSAGPQSQRSETVVGEGVSRSSALSQTAVSLGCDVLASEEIWSKVPSLFVGEKVADAQISCYRVQGFLSEQSEKVSASEQAEPGLWRVNNGSHILGPMSVREVAQALYSLELDFDCECWEETRGLRTSIEKSGIFGSAESENASFWVFDGEMVHGPFSEGFLKSGVSRSVFARDSFVCEKSTLNGWKPLMELRAQWKESAQMSGAAELPAEVPQPELAPPAEIMSYVETDEPSLKLVPPAFSESVQSEIQEEPTLSMMIPSQEAPQQEAAAQEAPPQEVPTSELPPEISPEIFSGLPPEAPQEAAPPAEPAFTIELPMLEEKPSGKAA